MEDVYSEIYPSIFCECFRKPINCLFFFLLTTSFNIWQVTLFLCKLMYSENQWNPAQRLELCHADIKNKLCGTVEISS